MIFRTGKSYEKCSLSDIQATNEEAEEARRRNLGKSPKQILALIASVKQYITKNPNPVASLL